MKITIIVEQQIPYTAGTCVEERQINPVVLYQSRFEIAGKVIREMLESVETVCAEMEKHGTRISPNE